MNRSTEKQIKWKGKPLVGLIDIKQSADTLSFSYQHPKHFLIWLSFLQSHTLMVELQCRVKFWPTRSTFEFKVLPKDTFTCGVRVQAADPITSGCCHTTLTDAHYVKRSVPVNHVSEAAWTTQDPGTWCLWKSVWPHTQHKCFFMSGVKKVNT